MARRKRVPVLFPGVVVRPGQRPLRSPDQRVYAPDQQEWARLEDGARYLSSLVPIIEEAQWDEGEPAVSWATRASGALAKEEAPRHGA